MREGNKKHKYLRKKDKGEYINQTWQLFDEHPTNLF